MTDTAMSDTVSELNSFSSVYQSDAQAGTDVVGVAVDVALVDDDPVIARLVKRVLTRQGYSVAWFADGVAAVAALCPPSAFRAKLILLDVSMPGLDGFGVLHYLRRGGVLDHSGVIMLTASASEHAVRQAIALGAIGYLAKPLDIRVLIERVQRSLA